MNPQDVLTPVYRVSQDYVELSGERPVRVGTYLYYRKADGWRMPDPPDDVHMECGITHRMPTYRSTDPHDHDYYEIVLVRGGSARHRTTALDTMVQAYSVIVVSPGQVHAFDEIDGLQNTNVYYLNEWLLSDLRALWGLEGVVPLFLAAALFRRPASPRIPIFRLSEAEMEGCIRELRDILAEVNGPNPSLEYVKWCFMKFLLILGRAYGRSEPDVPPLRVPEEIQLALERLEEYIFEGESFHVGSMAQELGLSTDHFSRIFKNATGWSPMDYFQRRRIQQAGWMLLNTPNSITEVAYTLGYCDSAHFSHLFKRHHGLSPRAYRKLYAPNLAAV